MKTLITENRSSYYARRSISERCSQRFSLAIAFLTTVMMTMLLSSCETLQELNVVNKPTVSLTNIGIRSISLQHVELDTHLTVENPNPIPVKLAGYDYQLEINGRQFLSGQENAQVDIPAMNSGKVTIPLKLNFNELKALSEGLFNKESVEFGLTTNAMIDLPVLGKLAFPASKTGSVPIPKVPKVSMAGFEVKSLGLTGAQLMLGINVDNPNSFGVNLKKLQGALEVNGVTWFDSVVDKPVNVGAKQAQTIEIPVKLDFFSMGKNVMALLQGGEPLTYRLVGGTTLDTSLPLLQNIDMPFDVSGKMSQRNL